MFDIKYSLSDEKKLTLNNDFFNRIIDMEILSLSALVLRLDLICKANF